MTMIIIIYNNNITKHNTIGLWFTIAIFVRELLKRGSIPPVTLMWGLNVNKKIQSSKVLIEEEFSEDSSDEEYKPNEEEQVI